MLDAKANTVMFDGCRAHAVSPFEGRRYSLVFFTSGSWENGDEATMSKYGLSSFTRPTTERLGALTTHVPPARGYPLARDAPLPQVAQWPRPMSKAKASDFAVNIDDQNEEHWSTVQKWMYDYAVARPGGCEPVGKKPSGSKPVSAPDKYETHTWERIDEQPK